MTDNEAREHRPIHVFPREDGWAVVREGNKKVSAVHPTQHQAEEHGRSLVRQSHAAFVLYDGVGRVRVQDLYGSPHEGEGEGAYGEEVGRVTVTRSDTGAVQSQVAHRDRARDTWTVEVPTYPAIDENNPGLREDPMGGAPTESDTYEGLSPDDMQRLYPELWEKARPRQG